MQFFRSSLLFLWSWSYLTAQPAYHEQSLASSGGTAVSIESGWSAVGDAASDKVHVYPLDYSDFLWDMVNKTEFSGPKTGAFGTSVAIDGDKIIVGAPDAETWSMEVQEITIANSNTTPNFTTVNLQRTYEEPPLIFVLPTTQGGNPSAIRIKNRTVNSFEIIHAEPKNLDGGHAAMTVAYLAIERGDHVLPDGTRILAAEYNTTNVRYDTNRFSSGETVAFDGISFSTPFSGQPMALGQIQTMANEQGNVPTTASSPWLTTAIRNVTSNGLELSLERSEVIDENEVTLPETIAYLVMDVTIGTFDDVNNNSISFESIYSEAILDGWDNGCDAVNFTVPFSSDPLVVASKNTLNGADGGWLRRCSLGTGSVGLTVDEDTYSDGERGHINERAGILAFSQAFSAAFKGGEAYLYEWDNANGWELQATIEPTTLNDDMKFGTSVGIHSNDDGTAEIAIGAPEAFSAAIGTGKVFTYSWDGTNATLNTILTGNVHHEHRFGASLDIKGDYLSVGAPDEESTSQNDFVGASYNYKFNGTDWEVNPNISEYRIKRNITDERFGTNVAINSEGNVSLISGGQNPTPTAIYTNDGSAWQETYVKNFRDGGDVDIDDGIYLMASRSLELNFYSTVIGDTDPAEPSPLTIARSGTDQAYTSVSLYKEQVLANEPENNQAVAIDVPCGIKPGKLTAFVWDIVSVPCGDSTATIDEIFGDDLGTYGENDNWVMYEQNGTEWSGTFASMRQLDSTDTMELGKGYWIITDTDASWKVDDPVVTTRTSLVTVSGVTVANDHIGGYYQYDLPAIGIGETKKIMAGNSFPRSFKWRDLLIGVTAHYPIGAIGFYEGTGYVYDISQSGQPYRAITSTGTPGIGDEIKPYQGFWIKQKSQTTGGSGIKLSIPFEK